MARTTDEKVGEIIEVEEEDDLSPFIESASSLVEEELAQYENATTKPTLSTARLELIERWLSAHFYAVLRPRTVAEKADVVSERFESKVDLNLANTRYGQQAMVLDTSGTLKGLNDPQGKTKVSLHWLGTDDD